MCYDEVLYPAIFYPNSDGSYTVTYPDLPGCITEGKSLENAMYMAQSALTQWVQYLSDKEQEIPQASTVKSIGVNGEEFVSLIRIDIKSSAIENGLSLSRVLQDALSEKLAH